MAMPLDPEFEPDVLCERLMRGAAEGDRVRLHGAITAAMNLYPRSVAFARVLMPALDRLGGGPAYAAARGAVSAHLLQARRRTGLP